MLSLLHIYVYTYVYTYIYIYIYIHTHMSSVYGIITLLTACGRVCLQGGTIHKHTNTHNRQLIYECKHIYIYIYIYMRKYHYCCYYDHHHYHHHHYHHHYHPYYAALAQPRSRLSKMSDVMPNS